MKQNKKLKVILTILVIILLSMISFGGIYVQNKNYFENIVPEYLLGRDLKGYRKVELKVSDEKVKIEESSEEKSINSEETLTKENFKSVKNVIEKRLKTMSVTDYEIRQNEENGTILLEIPENTNTDRVVGQLYSQGKFEIVDKNTGEVLMTNDDIKTVKSGYGTTTAGATSIFINIEFNKEGKEKFKNITNTYIETIVNEESEESNNSENETKPKTTTKEITLKVDDLDILTTHFDQEVSNGILQLSLGTSTNSTTEELQDYLIEANGMSALLDSGKMPIIYEVEQNKFVHSSIAQETIKILVVIFIAIVTVGMIYFIIKYKVKGIYASILEIGYIAILLISIRIFNVELTLAGLLTVAFTTVLNSIVLNSLVSKEEFLHVLKKYAILYIPILIIAVVFTFSNISLGPVLFWGIIVSLLYNLSFSKLLLEN